MPEPTPTDPAEPTLADWARQAARAADDKLGRDTVVIEVGDVLAIADFFVISGGGTARQVRAIADEVEEQLTLLDGPKPVRVEGRDDCRWILMDFGILFPLNDFDETFCACLGSVISRNGRHSTLTMIHCTTKTNGRSSTTAEN